jgi:ribosomal protein L12E/L44/L45/RPP1/RPP2
MFVLTFLLIILHPPFSLSIVIRLDTTYQCINTMERSLQAESSPRVTTRFEYAEMPSLRQLLAPVLANGHHHHHLHSSVDPLATMANATPAFPHHLHGQSMFQFGVGGLTQQQQNQQSIQPSSTNSTNDSLQDASTSTENTSENTTTSEEDEDDTQMPPLESITTTTGRPVRSAAIAARAAMTASSPAAASATATAAAAAAVKPEESTSPRKRRAKRRGSETPPSSSPKRSRSSLKPAPNAKKDPDSPELASCAICMCEPDREDVSNIDGCAHLYCFSCIGKWSDTENSCPLCKSRFSRIARVHPQRKKKGGPSVHNVKRVKHQDQRSDVVSGAALENLLASIAQNGTIPGASVAGSRLGYIFARMGNGFPMHGVRTSRVTTTFSGFSLEDNLFDSEDEDEESYVNVPNFMNVIMRSTLASAMAGRHRGAGGVGGNGAGMNTSMHAGSHVNLNTLLSGMPNVAAAAAAAAAAAPARSHATNAAQAGAGTAAENPLEIGDDSEDDDDDDVVEVVQVSRRT